MATAQAMKSRPVSRKLDVSSCEMLCCISLSFFVDGTALAELCEGCASFRLRIESTQSIREPLPHQQRYAADLQ
jgi:hypothetical protein